ncbi:MAG: c-type cytochrome [Planctomycetota bacterium]
MKPSAFTIVAVALTGLAVAAGWGVGKWKSRPTANLSERGRLLFQVNCASCHGPEGHGDGSASAELRPPPRDFAARPWRFPVTRESIRRVTLEGVPGAAMPASKAVLTSDDVEAVVEFVYQLANKNPALPRELSADQQLLKDANIADLGRAAPPKLKLTDASGASLSLDQLHGQFVVLHFWGTGCTHCIKEIPGLSKLAKKYDDRLAVLHVCVDEDDAGVAQGILDRLAPGSKAHTESSGIGVARFEVQALPTAWFLAPDGKALGRASGARDWESVALDALVRRWLNDVAPLGKPFKMMKRS